MVDIEEHYLNEDVKQIILDWCEIEEPEKAKRALIAGHSGWYRYKEGKKALIPADEKGYEEQVKGMIKNGDRSLYHSLNYFEPSLFDQMVDKDSDESPGGYAETLYYGLGTDIDLKDKEKIEADRDRDVTSLEDRRWLEKALKFHIDWLEEHGVSKDIIKPYFSGNGGYIIIDPSVIYIDTEPLKKERICRAYDKIIKKIEQDFFEKYPKGKEFVQFDALNNSKRQWKTPLSIHKSKNFCCIPLDVENPQIELERAKPPLSNEVISKTRDWIRMKPSEEREEFMKEVGNLLNKPILEKGKTPKEIAEEEVFDEAGVSRSKEPLNVELDLDDEKAIPPCIQRLLDGGELLSHARGKALLALFLNKVGLEYNKAKEKWNKLTTQAGGPRTNIFKSFFKDDFNLPKCETIQNPGSGFPRLNFGDIGVCNPDEKCEHVKGIAEYILLPTEPKLKKDAVIFPVYQNKEIIGKIKVEKLSKGKWTHKLISSDLYEEKTLSKPLPKYRESKKHDAFDWFYGCLEKKLDYAPSEESVLEDFWSPTVDQYFSKDSTGKDIFEALPIKFVSELLELVEKLVIIDSVDSEEEYPVRLHVEYEGGKKVFSMNTKTVRNPDKVQSEFLKAYATVPSTLTRIKKKIWIEEIVARLKEEGKTEREEEDISEAQNFIDSLTTHIQSGKPTEDLNEATIVDNRYGWDGTSIMVPSKDVKSVLERENLEVNLGKVSSWVEELKTQNTQNRKVDGKDVRFWFFDPEELGLSKEEIERLLEEQEEEESDDMDLDIK